MNLVARFLFCKPLRHTIGHFVNCGGESWDVRRKLAGFALDFNLIWSRRQTRCLRKQTVVHRQPLIISFNSIVTAISKLLIKLDCLPYDSGRKHSMPWDGKTMGISAVLCHVMLRAIVDFKVMHQKQVPYIFA